MNKIELPVGMKDYILLESKQKRMIQKIVEDVFISYNYQEIISPTLEYYSTYSKAFNNDEDETTYKMIDSKGRVVALKTDMTVPIARIVATKLNNEKPPFYHRYTSQVYKLNQSFIGKQNEVTDCGIECIGLDEKHDIEIIYIALDVLKKLPIKEYTLEIGNSNLFQLACSKALLDEETKTRLAYYIDKKQLVELYQYVLEKINDPKIQYFFKQLPILSGKKEVFTLAREICFDLDLLNEITKLENLYNDLEKLGASEYVRIDFGKIPHINYYTGIIFEAFALGVGKSILSGGRYDNLLKKFGRDLPAIGFSVKLDTCLSYMIIEPEDIIYIHYPIYKQLDALKLSDDLRKKGKVSMKLNNNLQDIQVEVCQSISH